MYELLPDHVYLKTKPFLYSNDEPQYGEKQTYFGNGWGFTEEFPVHAICDALSFKKNLKDLPPTDKRIFYGDKVPTPDIIVYQENSSAPSNKSEITTTDGSKKGLFCRGNSSEGGD